MATVASPYGLRPVSNLGSNGYNGATRRRLIANSYATAIFNGDVVKSVLGNVEKDVGTATLTPLGVFVGCEYVDPVSGQLRQSPYYPGSITSASPIWAFVVDDPEALFQVQSAGSIAQAELGLNVAAIQTAGNVQFGISRVAVAAAAAVTDTLPLRIVDFVYSPNSAPGDAFTDVIVRFNNHFYTTPLAT